jgi:hypothetical protein
VRAFQEVPPEDEPFAGRRALDRLRREQRRDDKHQAARMIHDDTPHEPIGPVDDDRRDVPRTDPLRDTRHPPCR